TDTLRFNGANVAENIEIVANGGRALLLRNIAAITMDLDDVEQVDFAALGGADNIIVGDLSGTDVVAVRLDLGAGAGGGDGQADTVTANATGDADVFTVTGDAGGVSVLGLPAEV